MDTIRSIINKRAKQLVVEGESSELQIIQQELERFHKDIKAVKLYPDRKVLIIVSSSAQASDIFMKQQQLLNAINQTLENEISGLRTKVA